MADDLPDVRKSLQKNVYSEAQAKSWREKPQPNWLLTAQI
jgi:hypothetical protein